VEVAEQIIQNGQLIFAPPFCLHVRRWSRHAFASGGGALPVLVDIELQGIPAHLWDLETAELLLGAHGLVQGLSIVSSEGVDSVDMTAFSVSFWCFSPEALPYVLFLHAVEPRVNVEVGSWFPRTMVFKIAVKVIRSGDMTGADQPPPLLLDLGGDDGDRDNHRRRPLMHYHPSPSARVSALSRLGPRVSSAVPGGGPVDAISPLMIGVERMAPGSTLPSGSVISFPVDAHSFSVLAVDEVVAPGSPDSTAQDVEWDPVDAHSLPLISVDGMVAPGVLVGTVDCGPAVQLGSSVLSIPAASPGSDIQVNDVLSGSVTVNAQFGISVQRNIWTVEPLNRMSSFLLSKMIHGWKDASPCLKVYSRRKKLVIEPVQDEECVLSSQLLEFKNDVTGPINSLLPPPRTTNRRRRTVPTNFIPRRSRRVAKFPPELGSSSAAQVYRQLGFCDEMENISLEDTNNYARLFKNGLSGSHVAAVAALFGWQVPLVGQC
jgi:hypothetical protein